MNAKVLGPWRPLDLLVVALPAALMAKVLDLGASVLFMLSALAVIPLAGLVGRSTEVLAETVGGSKGALLNATFGNIAELMIAALLVLNGEINILKASITGSIIGNLLLLLGVAMIVAAHNKSEVSISALRGFRPPCCSWRSASCCSRRSSRSAPRARPVGSTR